jgi:hypothetical protein
MKIAASKHVHLDSSTLEAHLHDYAKVMGKELGEVVREQAGHFCMDLVKYTRPFTSPGKGLDSGSKKKGEDNVQKALNVVFRPIKLATLQQLSDMRSFEVFKMWSKDNSGSGSAKSLKGQWDSIQKKHPPKKAMAYIGSDQGAMGKIHTKLRKYSGKGGLMDFARKSKTPFAFVKKENDIKSYAKQKAKDVGSLKAGYWYAAQKIRAKEVRAPAWIKHTVGEQYAIGQDLINQPMKPEALIGNLVGFRAMPKGLLNAAISYRQYAMRAKMAAELNKRKVPLWLATAQGLTTNTQQHF